MRSSNTGTLLLTSSMFTTLIALLALFARPSSTGNTGLIAYFEKECPEGWGEFKNSAGRMLVIEGKYNNLDANKSCNLAEFAGEYAHNLNINEMPTHSHSISAEGRHGRDYAYANDFYSSWGENLHPEAKSKSSEPVGGDQAHNNLSPYIVLVACKKLEETNPSLVEFVTNEEFQKYGTNFYLKQITPFFKEILEEKLVRKNDLPKTDELIRINDPDLGNYTKKINVTNIIKILNDTDNNVDSKELLSLMESADYLIKMYNQINSDDYISEKESEKTFVKITTHKSSLDQISLNPISNQSDIVFIMAIGIVALVGFNIILTIVIYIKYRVK